MKSESVKNIVVDLIKAQATIGVAVKNQKATGKAFQFAYADLAKVIETIKAPLNDNGIFFTQLVNKCEDGAVVETVLYHTSGEFISSETPIHCYSDNDPQDFGKAISYSKRYALMAILGLPTEDDDGAGNTKKAKIPTPKPTPKPITLPEKAVIPFKEYFDENAPDNRQVSSVKLQAALRRAPSVVAHSKLPTTPKGIQAVIKEIQDKDLYE